MKKNYFRMLAMMLLGMVGLNASAHDIEVENADGVTIYYNYSDDGNELTVTFLGDKYSTINYDYTGNVIIPDEVTYMGKTWKVTSIGNNAFRDCKSLTSVTIPNSVTSIGSFAFYGCSGLTSVHITDIAAWCKISFTDSNSNPLYYAHHLFMDGKEITDLVIPNSVTSIGYYAFSGCSGLTSITIPNSVTSIVSGAFYNCSSLTSVTIPNSVTSIGSSAFYNCTGLTTVTIPNSVTSIGSEAFYGSGWYNNQSDGILYLDNWVLGYKGDAPSGEITIADGTIGIANSAFAYCSDLTTITIPEGVIYIIDSAFSGCSGLSSITFPKSATYIGGSLFSGGNHLTSITIKEGNTKYDSRYNCNAVVETASNTLVLCCKNTTIPNNVIHIGDYAYEGCDELTSISIPNGVTTIGWMAFAGCEGLTSVYIPKSVTFIDEIAFFFTWNLTSVYVEWKTPISINSESFEDVDNTTLYVPAGTKSLYETAEGWKDFKEIIEITSDNITIPANGIATYCSKYDLDFTDVTGVKAYIASGFSPSTGELLLTRAYKVPAGEGLLLKGDADDYDVPTTNTDMVYSNLLKGVATATNISPTEGSYTNFILANGSHGIGFYTLSESGEIAAGKAYLQLRTSNISSMAPSINLVFDDDEQMVTVIKEVDRSRSAAIVYYDLQGRRIETPSKGLYIKGEKKVYFK